jgi:ubiquinone/menaquinone biosynthesis C-methylase UbiE
MTQAATQKAYKGMGMQGLTAKWYASLTAKTMHEFEVLAQRIAREIPRGSKVLEVAPGPGYFSVELAKLGDFDCTGLDIGQTFVQIARSNAKKAGVNVDFRLGDAAHMPFANQTFDFLLCRAAFKNFTQPVEALREMYRVLKPGGRALIIDLKRDASPETIDRMVNESGVGAINGVITKLTFRHMLLKRAYTKHDFEQMVAATPFRTAEICEDGISLEISLRRAAAVTTE